MYAGNALATVEIEGTPRVVSVRVTAFDAATKDAQKGAVEKLAVTPDAAHTRMRFVEFAETKSDRPVLTEARIVCSGGRGLKNGENFKIGRASCRERVESSGGGGLLKKKQQGDEQVDGK